MKSPNGISPVVSIILTAIMVALTIVFFTSGHMFWGIIFTLISIDFCADLVLSLKRS